MTRPTQTSPTEANHAGLTAIRYANKAIRIFEDIVFILVLLIGLWYLADTIYVFYHSRTEATMPFKPTDGDITALQKELSEDCVGWITLDDTSIDYPVMQGVDNYVYLNKDPYGDYSLAGSIFLDSRNASDLSDDYSVVYGHHMSGGFMFGSLDEFEDSGYFAEHTTGTLTTERGLLRKSLSRKRPHGMNHEATPSKVAKNQRNGNLYSACCFLAAIARCRSICMRLFTCEFTIV